MYSDKKWNQKNMKECDKRNGHTSSCVSSDDGGHPVAETFPALHPTTLHFTSLHFTTFHFLSVKLHTTTLYFSLIWLNPI
jgi:hypothetical protein